MDHVSAIETIAAARKAAVQKASLPAAQMVIRGALAGVFLGYATSLAMIIQAQGLPPIVAAICFPVGFVMLVLLGLELATGNFALLTLAVAAGEIRLRDLLRNWGWVYVGNLAGSVAYALLFYLAITNIGESPGGALGDQIRKVAQAKTIGYAALGARGWAAALVKGVLCNWMVTLGAVLAFASRSTIGKIAAMWLPIATFFAHGYEHSIVNMYVIPAGMLLGAPVSLTNWWVWNQVPVTIGNILAAVLLTALPLALSYPKPGVAGARVVRESDVAFAPAASAEAV
jgi:formate/nitrite transporter